MQFDRLLSSTKPSSNFAQVLYDRLKLLPAARANNSRPLLVTVIHDGSFDVIPNETTINGALTNFARDLKPRTDVDLAFLNMSDTASRSLHGIIDLQKLGVIAHVLNTETYAAAKHAGIQNSLIAPTAIGTEARSGNTSKSGDSSGIENAGNSTNNSPSRSNNSGNEQALDTSKAPDAPVVQETQNQPTKNGNETPSVPSSDNNSGTTMNTSSPGTPPIVEREAKESKESPTATDSERSESTSTSSAQPRDASSDQAPPSNNNQKASATDTSEKDASPKPTPQNYGVPVGDFNPAPN